MQKVIAFLNKHSILLNSIAIIFWLYIIITSYLQIKVENGLEERKNTFIIPILFIVISSFNIYLSIRRKKRL